MIRPDTLIVESNAEAIRFLKAAANVLQTDSKHLVELYKRMFGKLLVQSTQSVLLPGWPVDNMASLQMDEMGKRILDVAAMIRSGWEKFDRKDIFVVRAAARFLEKSPRAKDRNIAAGLLEISEQLPPRARGADTYDPDRMIYGVW